MKKIESKGYSIFFETGNFSTLDYKKFEKIAILVDENTKKYCLPLLLERCSLLEKSVIIQIDSGEENKNIQTCNTIWRSLIEHNFNRNSLIINLGGGMIGDIGGFVASTYKRGINFIQIPTTLLAMSDASVGSKLGINFMHNKNQIGLYNDPLQVLINIEFLKTLPRNQLLSGFSEIIKHALIADKNYWDLLIKTSFDNLNWEDIIIRSVEIKNKIVMKDPFENNERKKLNFGHTFGHAIESYYLEKSKPILHGEALALGMILEIKMSRIPNYERIINFIKTHLNIPNNPKISELKKWLINDKKNTSDKINFTLLKNIGESSINNYKSWNELSN
ncbi:MAG: 3-dehydroquinate synthase family protein [Bacteroidota bacterium]|nr:3-dehydroquinate synthase family protein [Bacteroidota bacterium]